MRRMLLAVITAVLMPMFVGCCCIRHITIPWHAAEVAAADAGSADAATAAVDMAIADIRAAVRPVVRPVAAVLRWRLWLRRMRLRLRRLRRRMRLLHPDHRSAVCCTISCVRAAGSAAAAADHYGGGDCGGPCYGGCGYGGGCGFNGCCDPSMVFNDGAVALRRLRRMWRRWRCGGCGYPAPCGSCCGGSPIMQGYPTGGCSSCGVQPGPTTPPVPVPAASGPATPQPTTMYNPAPYSQTMPVVQGAGGPILDSRYQAVTPARY